MSGAGAILGAGLVPVLLAQKGLTINGMWVPETLTLSIVEESARPLPCYMRSGASMPIRSRVFERTIWAASTSFKRARVIG